MAHGETWNVTFVPARDGTVILQICEVADGVGFEERARLVLSLDELDKLLTEGRTALHEALFPPYRPPVVHFAIADGTDVTVCGVRGLCSEDEATCLECLEISEREELLSGS